MATELAKYACDECRSRKIRCSRESSGCIQCKNDARYCSYSRSGVIRRRARQSKRSVLAVASPGGNDSVVGSVALTQSDGDPRPQLDEDLDQIKDSIGRFGDVENNASGSLATLGDEYSSFWQGPSLKDLATELNVEAKRFLPFPESQTALFTEACINIQKKGRPLFTGTPPHILRDIQYNPDNVADKAHLVIVYGVLLTDACLDDSYDALTIAKLRLNLRLALDDAKLLLEPSDLNIQALILLACHVQEVSTPSLCWMMISTACRMLQVMGVTHRSLDPATKQRRQFYFWLLNGLDKTLALIFGRPPTLHKTIWAKVPQIPLQMMLDYQPHRSDRDGVEEFRSMFGAHLMRQTHLLSVVLSDIWTCLFEDGSKFDQVKKDLDEWWAGSESVLRACLLSEKAFLSQVAQQSMELGIRTQEFHYKYLKVLLIRSRPAFRQECVSTSQQLLHLLEDLVSDSSEVYNGIIWMLLFCPWNSFFILLGDLLSKGNSVSSNKSLAAMKKMSAFLLQMKPRHPQAAKLHTVSVTLVEYAQTVLGKKNPKSPNGNFMESNSPADHASGTAQHSSIIVNRTTQPLESFTMPKAETSDQQPLLDLFNDPTIQALSMNMDFWLSNTDSSDNFGATTNDNLDMGDVLGNMQSDPYGFFADSTFDWFSWDPNT